MEEEYSSELCRSLEQETRQLGLHRPARIARYEPGSGLAYDIDPIPGTDDNSARCRIRLRVEKFVGGGFAGQVYKVRVLQPKVELPSGLRADAPYALKIFVPPSGFSLLFRDILYAIGFQGPFQLQCNPTAARAGALWQKLIRRGARIRFGDERVVNDVHATLVDTTLGSCGEISDWIDGRTWHLEVDEYLDALQLWKSKRPVAPEVLGSPEFRAKRTFMHQFVDLLHEMGAHEFARQYEWSTWKSQPNCLKRLDTEGEPDQGLVAVDFRAGLTLLPFLPMSPGDVPLILKGIGRGSLVQFDRGDLRKLVQFADTHAESFADLRDTMDELSRCEKIYRDSVPDITHNHVRLLYSGSLWSTMMDSTATGWRVRNLIDENRERRLRKSPLSALVFALIRLIPFVGLPLLKFAGHSSWRKHYLSMLGSLGYLSKSLKGRMLQSVVSWHRDGRIRQDKAERVGHSTGLFVLHSVLSLLPAGLHKFLTDWSYFKDRLYFVAIRPVRLYFDSALREQWLRDMVSEGEEERMISGDDAAAILSQIKEPFIQKYLRSLAVHVLTLPVTQIVSGIVAWAFWVAHPDMPPFERAAAVGGILVLFQIVPLSPGSLVRGLYVLFLVIKERDFRNYNIAIFLGFFKYVGYLSFPIQMAYRYPTLARFMATHWATNAVHVVPVFGERGALLERWVFDLFYNHPLTIRRRMKNRTEKRNQLRPRYWHAGLLMIAGAGLLVATDQVFRDLAGAEPSPKDIWYVMLGLPVVAGFCLTAFAAGAKLLQRIAMCPLFALGSAALYCGATYFLGDAPSSLITDGVWRFFLLAVISTAAALTTEFMLPDPGIKPIEQNAQGRSDVS